MRDRVEDGSSGNWMVSAEGVWAGNRGVETLGWREKLAVWPGRRGPQVSKGGLVSEVDEGRGGVGFAFRIRWR